MSDNLKNLVNWLEQRHTEVLGAENQALSVLKDGDTSAYARLMRQKAQLLADMASDCANLVDAVDAPARNMAKKAIKNFSQSASMALNLDSVFYMSALLYRDDHKQGEPDNLAVFITELKNQEA